MQRARPGKECLMNAVTGGIVTTSLLEQLKQTESVYASDDQFVVAGETMRGKQPYWPDNFMKRHIQPVANAIGIHKKIGWHTFRHSFGTLLKANGEDVKTVQELLRSCQTWVKR